MATKPATTHTATLPIDPTALICREAVTKNSDVIAAIHSITITSPDDYSAADLLLVRIRQARKWVKSIIDPIKKPQKQALDATQALFHELDDPLSIGETEVKLQMAIWQKKQIASGEERTSGAGSKTTVKKVVRVKDLTAFIGGVAAGTIPEICLEINQQVLNAYFEDDRGLVSVWPGVVIEDQVSVGGR